MGAVYRENLDEMSDEGDYEAVEEEEEDEDGIEEEEDEVADEHIQESKFIVLIVLLKSLVDIDVNVLQNYCTILVF